MTRRHFLLGLSAGAASTALTLLGADWWEHSPLKAAHLLDAVFEGAKANGKPLLVLVIPSNHEQAWFRGEQMGALLNHATHVQLAPLGLCELVCVPEAQVRARFPVVPAGSELVLVETDEAAPSPRMIEFERGPALPSPQAMDFKEHERVTLARSHWQLDALAQRLEVELWGRAGMRQRRLDQLRAAQGSGVELAAQAERLKKPGQAFVSAALAMNDGSDECIAALAQGVAARWRDQAPPGSQWARSGCGVRIEGELLRLSRIGYSCGIGHAPELSRRFLYLYVQKSEV
jgi:hypothetical protein